MTEHMQTVNGIWVRHEADGISVLLCRSQKSFVVEKIIEYMADGCQMKEEYRKRMDETFAFNDRNCSKRVYERIIENR